MSGPTKNTTTYSASDIQRYLQGEMSAREMHDLERTALEDPFLADALEGFEKLPSPDPAQTRAPAQTGNPVLNQHLDDLRTRLNTRVAGPAETRPHIRRNIFPLHSPWLRIAAAVILLLGLGFTAWYGLLNKSQQPVLAKREQQVVAPLTSDSAQVTPPPAATSSISSGNPNPPETTSFSRRSGAHPSRSSNRDDEVIPPAAQATPGATPAISPATRAGNLAAIPQSDSSSLSLTTPPLRAATHPLVLSGKVLDIHNNPLPGAVLHLSGNNMIGTTTDQNGYFSLKVYPKDSILQVTVGMIGYQQASLAFNTFDNDASTGNVIYLQQQNNALDEVVVSGYGAKRRETRALLPSPGDEEIDSLWIRARPVIGKQAYLDYLAAGKRTIGADTSVKGTVIISFDVTQKGELTSFKVEQSLTPAHDTGLIQLISAGPAWKKMSKSRRVRAAVRVVF